MNYNKLDDLDISEIIFGGASLSGDGGGYGFGAIEDNKAYELIDKALDLGINTFDTAPIYGFNQSEITLATHLKNKREKVNIISKCGVSWHSTKRVNMTNDPKTCQKMLDESLKKFEYLDIYMIHWPDKKNDIRYTLEVLAKAQQRGDIKHIGLCNTHQQDLNKAREVAPISCVQSEVNLFHNAFETLDFKGFKMGWGSFDKGILTGSVTIDRKFDSSDCRSWAPWWKKSNWKEKVKKVEKLYAFAQEYNLEPIHFALGYGLKNVGLQSALCGMKNIKQLEQIIDVYENLPDHELINRARKFCE